MSEDIRDAVRQKYAQAITLKTSCCGGGVNSSSCCGGGAIDPKDIITSELYKLVDLEGLPEDMRAASFGCGNPTLLAQLNPGEVVLDLGSGAGLDVLLSAKRVGPDGKAYGLDMTDEMLAEAQANQARSGVRNAEFLKGHIENIPLPDSTVDVIISNCVINLSGDKDQVFREAYRVLKPGGRLAIADIVLTRALSPKIQQDLTFWAACVGGALMQGEYREKLAAAGFKGIDLEITHTFDISNFSGQNLPFDLSARELQDIDGTVLSAFIRAKK